MVTATLGGVIGTGLALGIVHVLTGPDHLSALATLSVGKTARAAFGLGVRWGCGHSFGLLIVAIIFFALGQSVNIDTLTYWADFFVGIFMVVLGLWYIVKAWKEKQAIDNADALAEEARIIDETKIEKLEMNGNDTKSIQLETIEIDKNKKSYQNDLKYDTNILNGQKNESKENERNERNEMNENKNDNQHSDDGSNHSDTGATATTNQSNSSNSSNSSNNSKSTESESDDDDDPSLSKGNIAHDDKNVYGSEDEDDNDENDGNIVGDAVIGNVTTFGNLSNALTNAISDDDLETDATMGYREESKKSKCMTRVMAFVAGVFHGIAGPGGVLGVMVALKLNSWIYSSLYMFIFFVSSICTMGVYAIVYGFATARMTLCANNKQLCAFYLKLASAFFSIIVGVLWLTLTFTGTLDEIFD